MMPDSCFITAFHWPIVGPCGSPGFTLIPQDRNTRSWQQAEVKSQIMMWQDIGKLPAYVSPQQRLLEQVEDDYQAGKLDIKFKYFAEDGKDNVQAILRQCDDALMQHLSNKPHRYLEVSLIGCRYIYRLRNKDNGDAPVQRSGLEAWLRRHKEVFLSFPWKANDKFDCKLFGPRVQALLTDAVANGHPCYRAASIRSMFYTDTWQSGQEPEPESQTQDEPEPANLGEPDSEPGCADLAVELGIRATNQKLTQARQEQRQRQRNERLNSFKCRLERAGIGRDPT
jgi:hypothetical protein